MNGILVQVGGNNLYAQNSYTYDYRRVADKSLFYFVFTGSVKELSQLLSVADANKCGTANELITFLTRKTTTTNFQLLSVGETSVATKKFKKYLSVDNNYGSLTVVLSSLDSYGGIQTTLYSGNVKGLENFDNPLSKLVADLQTKTGKLLRFKYNGGSKPGEIRIVRLEKVTGTGDNTRLEGTDLSIKQEGNEKGYRAFHLNKVDGGGVEVLN